MSGFTMAAQLIDRSGCLLLALDPIDFVMPDEIESLNPGRSKGFFICAVMLGVPLPKPQSSGFVVCSAIRWIRHGSVLTS
ncbi:hypothetical protein [Rhizobium laguerreae]|uniref:hypothetical protein n=1 Tax=Rhizobium laguerreae TaxID=1076926 RepID=UPI001C8FBAC1|nr:hypothetical protein [Rhizobium laguerreae]MBY3123148.1 hypothetical protein [Rhizobium laguerreae]